MHAKIFSSFLNFGKDTPLKLLADSIHSILFGLLLIVCTKICGIFLFRQLLCSIQWPTKNIFHNTVRQLGLPLTRVTSLFIGLLGGSCTASILLTRDFPTLFTTVSIQSFDTSNLYLSENDSVVKSEVTIIIKKK